MITLAIIGIVATLTIPTVIAKYNQKAQYTAFMKVYNMLSNVFNIAQVQNGSFDTWSSNKEGSRDLNVFNEYLADKLKISKQCATNADCSLDTYTLKGLSCPNHPDECEMSFSDFFGGNVPTWHVFLFQDGSMLIFQKLDDVLTIDANGVKGPNVLGRDIFMFEPLKINGLYKIYPRGAVKDSEQGIFIHSMKFKIVKRVQYVIVRLKQIQLVAAAEQGCYLKAKWIIKYLNQNNI